jgi:hypothetical protein
MVAGQAAQTCSRLLLNDFFAPTWIAIEPHPHYPQGETFLLEFEPAVAHSEVLVKPQGASTGYYICIRKRWAICPLCVGLIHDIIIMLNTLFEARQRRWCAPVE